LVQVTSYWGVGMDEEERPSVILRHLIDGYQVSQAIHVAGTISIADLLAECPFRHRGRMIG
jgi:hypothetical protein